MSPEVTWDPSAGEAFVSRNGAAIDAPTEQLELPVETASEPEPVPTDDSEESAPSPEETTEEKEPQGFNRQQVGAINHWKERGYDMESVLSWVDGGEETPISDCAYQLAAEKFGSDDPKEMGKAIGVLAAVHSNQKAFDYEVPETLESLPDHVEQNLVTQLGGEFASEVVNLNHRVQTGEMTYAEAQAYVFSKPDLLNKMMHAADKDWLRFSI